MDKDDTATRQDMAYWLALLRMPAIGNVLLAQLLNEFTSPQAIFRADTDALSKYGLKTKTIEFLRKPPWTLIDNDLAWLQHANNHLITIHDKFYPQLLKQIHDPPVALYVSGDPGILNTLQISLVGSRNPTADGRRIARDFACCLAGIGITITSGLALGVDSCSHLGALDAAGTTIAVLGCGLDIVYPASNKKLAASIIEKAALVSEFPPGVKPLPENFPRRNRIISGMSLGTLVIEAALRSGSLITAGHALEQGREVFAIPGSIHNPLARGCHALLRQGAKLTESINDILEELGPLSALIGEDMNRRDNQQKIIKGLDEHGKLLLDNIGSRPVSIDYLVEETRLAVNVVSSMLLNLELRGLIESLPGGAYTRI